LAANLLAAGDEYDQPVCIVDSATHFWRKPGGTISISEGKFTGWKEARAAQDEFVDAVMSTRAGVLLCVRSKIEYAQTQEQGRHVVTKLGMAPMQDDTLEYELNIALDIDIGHTLTVGKSRTTALPVGTQFQPGHAADFATTYREWLEQGEPLAPIEVVKALEARLAALTDQNVRTGAKREWFEVIGRPEALRQSQVDTAERIVARAEAYLAAQAAQGAAAPEQVPLDTVAADD
jgi:hypothetical protein